MNRHQPISPPLTGSEVLRRREALGLSQAELARLIPSRFGVHRRLSRQAIWYFESGRRRVHPLTALWLRDVLRKLELGEQP